jgi:predicted AlkP superfamily phosphohydrolase/phosphomutase
MNTTAKQNQQVVVIGIDGFPYTLIHDLIDRGVMPNFANIVQTGSLLRMKSTLPEVSSVAWSSFMTGCGPGEHGIFGFMELDSEYGYRFPNFTDIKVPTIWEKLKIPSVIINVPETYPAVRPLNGLLISGFVAVDLNSAVYPNTVAPALRQMGYRLDVNARLAVKDPDAFFEDLMIVFEKRCEAIRHFFEHENWQLFIGTITETDRLHHYFFNQVLDEGPYHTAILEFYRRLDRFIGEMFDRAMTQNALFLTCSDHGFCSITQEVYVNKWLMMKGYLDLNGHPGLKGITESSRAFCLDPGRIYIHSKGRYPRGCVQQSEVDSLKNELADQFNALQSDGESVIKRVFFGEEIFNGPYTSQGPDLYLLSNPGFDIKGSVGRPAIFGRSHFTGMHTMDDAHLFISTEKDLKEPHIADIAHIISTYLNHNVE